MVQTCFINLPTYLLKKDATHM